jgi:hypothetical protein
MVNTGEHCSVSSAESFLEYEEWLFLLAEGRQLSAAGRPEVKSMETGVLSDSFLTLQAAINLLSSHPLPS